MGKEKTIIFYGDDWTPMSNDCYGCYHYGTICEGSIYAGGCGAGIVEDIRPSLVAQLLLNYTNNRFILARSFGYDIDKQVDKSELKTNELKEEYEKAIDTSKDVIEEYKKMYSVENFSEVY